MVTINVVVVGAGYVGLVTGLCFAKLGHSVACVDVDESKIKALRQGQVPFYEPGLVELLGEQVQEGRISFHTTFPEPTDAAMAVVAVGTPPTPTGSADLTSVFMAVDGLARALPHGAVVAIKSTVPVGTASKLKERLAAQGRPDLRVASVPEFLREGQAIQDVFRPYRMIFGVMDEATEQMLRTVHEGLDAPVVVTDTATAEMIKYASNAFLATKISFINEIANICDRVGADVTQVAYGMGLDPRIGPSYLRAGLGYGGSCFPKDTRALVNIAGEAGYDFQLLRAVVEVNQRQRLEPVRRLKESFGTLAGRVITLLGVAFKPGTDDVRESPAIDLYVALMAEGAVVRMCDPVVRRVRGWISGASKILDVCNDPYLVLAGADAAVVVTEWPEFVALDWRRVARFMRCPVVFDGRNVLKPDEMKMAGVVLLSVGRGCRSPIPLR
ncbi:UDPglucose 6-dehydrogenase [Alicyclobacillus macrosporangiidus]|uniref:UDP-glucose 6-dehydrogenase n=1 Tax=Alicyclobacillus macrosporangiidus TaxID=392015 RepID=A0A1I7G5D3_9BACL|nr:UDPglucose 6-dehydrogenase [Alicyclobacillus macrosporangiidus]